MVNYSLSILTSYQFTNEPNREIRYQTMELTQIFSKLVCRNMLLNKRF